MSRSRLAVVAFLCASVVTALLWLEGRQPGRLTELPTAPWNEPEPARAFALEPVAPVPRRERLAAEPARVAASAPAGEEVAVIGRVVDSVGRPVAGARVSAHRWFGGSDVPMRLALGEAVVTRRNGSFAMKCWRPDDTDYSLEVEAEGYVQAGAVSVSPGDRNVIATLARPGVLEGHWRAPRGLLLPDDIRVRVDAENGTTVFDSAWESAARDARFSRRMTREWIGFSMRGLAPGWYSLELGLRETLRTIARVDRLLVREGATTLDPRLDPFDLGASLRVFVLDARGPDGARPLALRVQSSSAGWPYWHRGEALRLRDGRFRILAPDPALDLLIAADGHRDLALEDVRSDTLVHLEPGLDVRIVLEDPPTIPTGETLYLSLMPRDSTTYELRREAATVGPDQRARFALPRPGRYEASLSFRPSGEMELGVNAIFQVLERTEPQELRWSGTRAAILEALETGRR